MQDVIIKTHMGTYISYASNNIFFYRLLNRLQVFVTRRRHKCSMVLSCYVIFGILIKKTIHSPSNKPQNKVRICPPLMTSSPLLLTIS